MKLHAPAGVFSPLSDTWQLSRQLEREPTLRGGSVLDLCAGSGALAIVAALEGAARVTAVDASLASVHATRVNARLNKVEVRALCGDLFEPVDGERFDLIVSNPPYVPAGSATPLASEPAEGFDAGEDGRELLDRICARVADHLNPGGVALLVHSSICSEEKTLQALRDTGLEAEVADRRRGPLGPLMSARAEELEERGLLAPGQRDEEVLVIRAQPARE